MTDKRFKQNTVISVASVLILSATYLFVLNWEPKNAPVYETSQQIIAFEADDILSVEVANLYGSYTITKHGNSYTISGKDNVDLVENMLLTAVGSLKKMPALRRISSNKLSDFGLETPTATLNITTSTENFLVKIGNNAPDKTGRYMQVADEIYLVPSGIADLYITGVQSYESTEIATIDTKSISSVELYNGDKCIAKIRPHQDSDTLENQVSGTLVMTEPYYEYVSTQRLSEKIDTIAQISAKSIEEKSLANINSYGIGKYTIKITDSLKTHTLILGNQTPGSVYGVYEGKDVVYCFDNSYLTFLETFDAFDYITKFVQIYGIDKVAKVEYKSPKGTRTIEIKNDTYYIDSKKVSADKAKTAYQAVIGIMFTSKTDVVGTEQIGSVTYTFIDGSTDTARYYEQDERNYTVVRSDGTAYSILKKNFDRVFDDISL